MGRKVGVAEPSPAPAEATTSTENCSSVLKRKGAKPHTAADHSCEKTTTEASGPRHGIITECLYLPELPPQRFATYVALPVLAPDLQLPPLEPVKPFHYL